MGKLPISTLEPIKAYNIVNKKKYMYHFLCFYLCYPGGLGLKLFLKCASWSPAMKRTPSLVTFWSCMKCTQILIYRKTMALPRTLFFMLKPVKDQLI